MRDSTCSDHAGTGHSIYPHEPGTHYGCYACETHHHPEAGEACVCDECVGFTPFDMEDASPDPIGFNNIS